MTPFKGTNQVTSPFGRRNNPITGKPEMHNGQDIVTTGAKYTEAWMVRETTGGGKVIEASIGWNNGRGNLVRVQYPKHKNYVATYQHMERIDVKVGQMVKQGARLGLAGKSGSTTQNGEHLHFEIRTAPGEGGVAIDPHEWSGVPNAVGTYPGNDKIDP